MKRREENSYEDIINLPHHVSAVHPQMSLEDRAAQFAPFAALTGHKEAVREAGRRTEKKLELDENMKMLLDIKLQTLMERMEEHPRIRITYFLPDDKKSGGRYMDIEGEVKKLDEYSQEFVFAGGERILLRDVLDLDGDIFREI